MAAALATVTALPFAMPLASATDSGSDHIALLGQVGAEDDADSFHSLQLRGGALFDYRSYLQNAGFALQTTHYSQDGWNEDVPAILGIYRNQRPDTLAGLRAEVGLVSVAGHARPVGDATWSLRPRESTGFELIAAGDVVGTRAALEKGITYGLLAASAEQQFGQRLTGIALLGWQPFTDGNSRDLFRARLIYSLLPEQGLVLQARWRQYSSSSTDVGGAYFNPEHYRNWDAGLSWRRHIGSWTLSALGGAGQERINDTRWQTTGIVELRAEGTLSGGNHLAVGLLYSRAAGFAATPEYWYGGLNASLIIPLAR